MKGAPIATRPAVARMSGVKRKGILLHGGPMDGWVVKEGAPVLKPGWHETWPPAVSGGRVARFLHAAGVHRACRNHPGRYVMSGAGEARWEEL